MSLSSAFRKLGNLESLRKYTETNPSIAANYAREAYTEIGDALEHTIRHYLYDTLDIMQEEQAERQEEFIRLFAKEMKKIIAQSVAAGVAEGVKQALIALQQAQQQPEAKGERK
mgnify:CR=1 FL=1